jgi:hypothetical protein
MDFVKEIKVFCAENDIKPSALMVAAGLPIRTWQGWQRGVDPKLSNANRVRDQMAKIKIGGGA